MIFCFRNKQLNDHHPKNYKVMLRCQKDDLISSWELFTFVYLITSCSVLGTIRNNSDKFLSCEV